MSSAGWPAKQMHMEQTWRHWTETGRGNQELSTLLFHPPPFSFETKTEKAGKTSKCKSWGGILDPCPVLLHHSARHAGPSGLTSAMGKPNTTATMYGLGWGERWQVCLKQALKDQVWELHQPKHFMEQGVKGHQLSKHSSSHTGLLQGS